ncbi:hypothetical protein DSO57_1004729 [Entomophthora muscae]|uniref:Uncharacterized protein n=1 Tax=Entomophthora muscae TaxID=34485 RepID=A0ACC2TIQ2_9FUNG|nr:hypothetical protein DSO57_1004729 [Entomophthora muscae]
MSTATGELPLIPSSSSYDYSKLGFAYLTMLGLTEQVIPHMGVWRPWATAANYVMWMAPVIYWAFQAQPFPLTKGSPGSSPGHDTFTIKAFANDCIVGLASKSDVSIFAKALKDYSKLSQAKVNTKKS